MNIFSLSEQESRIYNLRLARAKKHLEDFDQEVLLREMAAGKFDVCKLKINSTVENIFYRLDSLGIPYSIYSIIVRNSKEISAEDGQYQHENFSFEQFDGSQKEIFINLVKDAVIYRTATNYSDDDLSLLMPQEKELEALEQYNLLFNPAMNKNLAAWLMKLNGEYIGFVTGEFSEDCFEGIFYGITKNKRGVGNYARVLMGFLKKMCYERGIKYFKNDVVFQNFSSLISIMKESINPIETYLNLNLKCFFSHSASLPRNIVIQTGQAQAYHDCWKMSLETLKKGFSLNSFTFKIIGDALAEEDYQMRIAQPVLSEKKILTGIQLLDKNKEIKAFSYARAIKL